MTASQPGWTKGRREALVRIIEQNTCFDEERQDHYVAAGMAADAILASDPAPSLYEALADAPILSKYHGQRGFEADRFIADYEAWKANARAALALARGEQP